MTATTAARIGVGGPVGSGKTTLVEALAAGLQARGRDLVIVTNDLLTTEDADRLKGSGIIDPARVVGVEAGGCPHTVIREDPSLNLAATVELEARFPGTEVVLLESGGDNLASTFSRDLVDFWMFVIDVAGGDDIPRKRGPGVVRCDLLVVNKVDLAPFVGADVERMVREADEVRSGRPVIRTNARSGEGVDDVIQHLEREVLFT